MRTYKSDSAFTLIELLVVISIIAILLGIMLPSLAAARERSKRVICASNIRQCILSCSVYAGDYNGFLPQGNVGTKETDPEGWLDINFNTALTMHDGYQVDETIAMCKSWEFEREKYFYQPQTSDSNFKLGGTRIGYIYYGRRFDLPGNTLSPLLENGQTYKCPKKFDSYSRNTVTSPTLFTCFHYDSISCDGPWGAKIPHVNDGRGIYYQPESKKLDPKPAGLVTGFIDGAARWVKWKKLKSITQDSKIRLYYSD